MADLSRHDPTGRFSGLAGVYARWRPDYPDDAVAYVLERCGLGPGSLLVDVGCGTGISSRTFAAHGLRVLGIEPNGDMRARAEAEPWQRDTPVPVYREGRAEATRLPDRTADAVLSAQAFHWFEADAALREFHRILKPGGWVALIWNERDDADPFTADYGKVIRATREAGAVERVRHRGGDVVLSSPLFKEARRVTCRHEQPLTEEGLVGRAFSTSYAPREPAAVDRAAAALRDLFARHQQGGLVRLRYETAVYTARRPPAL